MFKAVDKILPWFVLLILFFAGYKAAEYFQTEQETNHLQSILAPTKCQFNSDPCQVKFNGSIITITVQGDVTPLKPFSLHLEGNEVEAAEVSFSMRDMDMGVNRFLLHKVKNSAWETQVMLPVCTARRDDWVADFVIKLNGKTPVGLQYPFNTR